MWRPLSVKSHQELGPQRLLPKLPERSWLKTVGHKAWAQKGRYQKPQKPPSVPTTAREADRVILTMCQEQGAQPHTFSVISQQLGNKTPVEVSHRFRELMQLFHTACEASSEDEDDATSTSNADQLSDHGDLLSEEELDE